MAVEVVYGESRNRDLARSLETEIRKELSEGTIYLGYPVLATVDEKVFIDCLVVSQEHGLAAFLLAEGSPNHNGEWARYVAEQDELFSVLESHLRRHPELRRGRELAFHIETVSVFASDPGDPPADALGHFCGLETVSHLVASFPGLDPETEHALQAAIQRVTTQSSRRSAALPSPAQAPVGRFSRKSKRASQTWTGGRNGRRLRPRMAHNRSVVSRVLARRSFLH
jgi:hypothetical protein